MDKSYYIKSWALLLLVTFLSSCTDTGKEDQVNNITTNTGLYGLSVNYDEYYSGYWKGNICGGNGKAIVGINGTSAELYTGATFMSSMLGTVDSSGLFSFAERQVNWSCETCGEVRPLEIAGTIDWSTMTGNIAFEVACGTSSGTGHRIDNIIVNLTEGTDQPSPSSELNRLESEALALIGTAPYCTENLHCKAFNIDEGINNCDETAIAYSTLDTSENSLVELQIQYGHFQWLATPYTLISNTTYCLGYKYPRCDSNICVMR